MTKYIVKNCPSLDDVLDVYTSKTVYKNHCLNKNCACKDRTDCPIKQTARIASEYYDIYCNHCVTKNCDGCHFDLAKEILQTLQVEEVE